MQTNIEKKSGKVFKVVYANVKWRILERGRGKPRKLH